ncbi:MAG: hypothetical protein ACI319_09045 [Holdemanella porci]
MVWLVAKVNNFIFEVNNILIIERDVGIYCIRLGNTSIAQVVDFSSKEAAERAYQSLWNKIMNGDKYIDFDKLDVNTGLWKAW